MSRAPMVKAVPFHLICLCLVSCLMFACTSLSGTNRLMQAEDKLAAGNTVDIKDIKVKGWLPPGATARQDIALALNAMLKDTQNTSYAKKLLRNVMEDPLTPRHLEIEAGYMLTLIELIEAQNKEISKLDQGLRTSTEREKKLKKERDDLMYKLKKMEEIYIHTEKRRGMQ